jgi:hypothetical protein
MFYHETEIEQCVNESRYDSGTGHTGGSLGHSYISDPTAIQGIKAAMDIKKITLSDGSVIYWPEKWLKVIRSTYQQGNETQQQAIRMRYQELKNYRLICESLFISPNVYYTMLNDAQNYAIAAACQEQIIRVME